MMSKVLLAEDDHDFGSLLKQYLELHKYNVTWAKNGEEAFTFFKENTPDICVFDVMMPIMDGFTLAENIIEYNPEIPFVFLTARKQKEDKIKGLKLGADDYIVKPFEADILVLKLQNILKRTRSFVKNAVVKTEIKMGKFSFDTSRKKLVSDNETHQLTDKEARLLIYLFKHRNTLLKRNQILKEIWGNEDYFSGRSMDVFMSRLRKYFVNEDRVNIQSIRGIGIEFKLES